MRQGNSAEHLVQHGDADFVHDGRDGGAEYAYVHAPATERAVRSDAYVSSRLEQKDPHCTS